MQPALGISFRIQLDQLHPVTGSPCNKGNKMGLVHGMIHCDKLLIFHSFNLYHVFSAHFFRLKLWQWNAAAADGRLAGGRNYIAANRADIEYRALPCCCC